MICGRQAGDVAVALPTVTEIVPFVALAGIWTTRAVVVAESPVTVTPFRVTTFSEGVRLKPWPWMVMVPPAGTVPGVTLKTSRAPGTRA